MMAILALGALAVHAERWCLISSSPSEGCAPGCRALVSQPGEEIVGEFACGDGSLHSCVPPYADVAASVQRSLLEPMYARPDVAGVRHRTNTEGDGWLAPGCASTRFQGERLLDPVPVEDEGCESAALACVCPIPPESNGWDDAGVLMKVRVPGGECALGRGLGYDGTNLTAYAPGWYVVSSFGNRSFHQVLEGGPVVTFPGALAAQRFGGQNATAILQVTDGAVEHAVGGVTWNGTHVSLPFRAHWQFVSPGGGTLPCGGSVWCAAWADGHVRVASQTFFLEASQCGTI